LPATRRSAIKTAAGVLIAAALDGAPATTEEILDHHLKCFVGVDLDGIVADYAPDAILFTPAGTLKGRDTIRALFQTLFAEFAKPGFSATVEKQSVEGEYAYILWNARSADNTYEHATDTFVIRGGKIVAQSFAAKITPTPR
jgi:ketosteroid isomerase-like protein